MENFLVGKLEQELELKECRRDQLVQLDFHNFQALVQLEPHSFLCLLELLELVEELELDN